MMWLRVLHAERLSVGMMGMGERGQGEHLENKAAEDFSAVRSLYRAN